VEHCFSFVLVGLDSSLNLIALKSIRRSRRRSTYKLQPFRDWFFNFVLKADREIVSVDESLLTHVVIFRSQSTHAESFQVSI
jgi:hypothetical protein